MGYLYVAHSDDGFIVQRALTILDSIPEVRTKLLFQSVAPEDALALFMPREGRIPGYARLIQPDDEAKRGLATPSWARGSKACIALRSMNKNTFADNAESFKDSILCIHGKWVKSLQK
jgi:hypothetical protein